MLRWAGAVAGAAGGVETVGVEAAAAGAAFGAADCTSSLRIRPPTPVPVILERFTPSSEASLRTIGVTYASSGCAATTGAETTGAATTGAATTGAATTGAATTGAATTGAGVAGATGAATAPAPPITARRAPTGTVVSTGTSIEIIVPATGEGISVSTLSVDTSSKASSTATLSPTPFNQRVTVPSLTLSPSAGIVIIGPALLAAGADAAGGGVTGAAAAGADVTGGGVTGAAATGAAATGAAGAEVEAGAVPSAIIASSAPTGTV